MHIQPPAWMNDDVLNSYDAEPTIDWSANWMSFTRRMTRGISPKCKHQLPVSPSITRFCLFIDWLLSNPYRNICTSIEFRLVFSHFGHGSRLVRALSFLMIEVGYFLRVKDVWRVLHSMLLSAGIRCCIAWSLALLKHSHQFPHWHRWAYVHYMYLLSNNGIDWYTGITGITGIRCSNSLPSFKKRLKTHEFFSVLRDMEIGVHLNHLVADYPRLFTLSVLCDLSRVTNLIT